MNQTESNRALQDWRPRQPASRRVLEGRAVRLEPLDPARHGDDLYRAGSGPGSEDLWRYLAEAPFADRSAFEPWLTQASASDDPLFFSIVSRTTGRAEGRLALMRIDTANGVIEVGNILFGRGLARTCGATEAVYLLARYVFDDLGYRRFEWKCNNLNEPSKRAALRLGFAFEGIFRQHMIVKGQNRDTAWFAMLDTEWPQVKAALERWLAEDNFEPDGRQRVPLSSLTAGIRGGHKPASR